MFKNKLTSLALSLIFLFALGVVATAQDTGQMNPAPVDKRKLTTIQTASADSGTTKDAVQVRYLNLPWGEATFGYIETGLDPRNKGYYAGRAWPIAHLRLNVPATYDGKKLQPGDYVFVITPRNAKTNTDMTIALESFTPAEAGGTFLKAGDVFVETPKDAQVISRKTVKFAKSVDKSVGITDQLKMSVDRNGKDVKIKFYYGYRTHTEKLKLA